MIFLDTNIWIELFCARVPVTENEKRQAMESGRLLLSIIENEEQIVTCKEQLLEIINAIEKVKKREINKKRKEESLSGIGSLKEFRKCDEFDEVQELCDTIIEDIAHFATIKDLGDYSHRYIKSIVGRLKLADINDCIYYDYCLQHNIDLYSFDADLKNLGEHEKLHII
ncbi:PIN domain-containing protein [Anaerotignum sp.]